MDAVKYSHSKHGAMVAKWLKARGMQMPAEDLIYDTGFVIHESAVAFLCKTNSKTAFIDQLAVRPGLLPFIKAGLIKAVIKRVEEEAKALGYSQVAAFPSVMTNLGGRLIELGYAPHGSHQLFSKSLSEAPCLG